MTKRPTARRGIPERCNALDVPFSEDPVAQSLVERDGGSDTDTIAEAYGVTRALIQRELRFALRKFARIYKARFGEWHDPT